jgi:short-subunit dehydrogenase
LVVLVTGASSGIGRGLALHYLALGRPVAAVARREAELALLHDEPQSRRSRFQIYPMDVTDRTGMAEVIAAVERDLGPIELAIAGAGIADEQTTSDLDVDGLERMLTTNVLGVVYTLAPVIAAMAARQRGQIVAISSLAAVQSLPRLVSYCASKVALNYQMEGLYWLLRPHGIHVTTICPGFVATEMTAGRVPPRWCMAPDRAVAKIAASIARKRRLHCFPVWLYLVLRMLHATPDPIKGFAFTHMDKRLFPRQPAYRAAGTSRSEIAG